MGRLVFNSNLFYPGFINPKLFLKTLFLLISNISIAELPRYEVENSK